jgi:hypothetical protein
MRIRTATRGILLAAAAVAIPACGSGGPAGPPGPSSSSGISYDNSLSGLAATTVQQAIDELDFRIDLLEQVPEDSVTQANPSTSFTYTVPAGKSLIITYFRASGSAAYTVGGVAMGFNAVNLGRIVVNEGELVSAGSSAGDTPRMHGYLVSKAKAPGVGIHLTNSPSYTVPAGKTLYITHLFAPVTGGGGDITIDGKVIGPLGVIPQGESVFLPVAAGKVVNPVNTSTVHGYLR